MRNTVLNLKKPEGCLKNTFPTYGMDHYFFIRRVTFFVKKNGSQAVVGWKKIVCFKVMKEKDCLQSKGKSFKMH